MFVISVGIDNKMCELHVGPDTVEIITGSIKFMWFLNSVKGKWYLFFRNYTTQNNIC